MSSVAALDAANRVARARHRLPQPALLALGGKGGAEIGAPVRLPPALGIKHLGDGRVEVVGCDELAAPARRKERPTVRSARPSSRGRVAGRAVARLDLFRAAYAA
jgi:hypothetical protein